MIAVHNLYKRYHGMTKSPWILKDINFTVPKGVSVGVIGRNGAGKSTLLRLLGGMDRPDHGKVIRDCRVSWPLGSTGGFQGSMTARQNVRFVARVHGDDSFVDEIIRYVEDFAEIGEAFDRPVNTYSSGMRSRVNFGLSLAFHFDVYLSDEATAAGDRIFKNKASKVFKERVGEASLIMVSHAEKILQELCQSGIWLEDGHATWFDDIDDALAAYRESTDQA